MVLEFSRNAKAKQKHDNIFALRSLVVDDSDISSSLACLMQPDYSSHSSVIFTRLAEYLLQHNPDYVFENAGTGEEKFRPGTLPTWVPYWPNVVPKNRHSAFVHKFGAKSARQGEEDYNAGAGAPFIFRTLKGRKLRISAIEVSVLSSLSDPWALTGGDTGPPIRNFYESCAQLCKQSLLDMYGPTGQLRSEAFWRTLIGDKVRETPSTEYSFPAPVEWEQVHQDWLTSTWGPDGDIRKLVDKTQSTNPFGIQFAVACFGKPFAVTANEYMALVPHRARSGDTLCVIPGIKSPLLLRQKKLAAALAGGEESDVNSVEVVGSCYVHGLMEGQIFSEGVGEKKFAIL
jgi:hypothetical protein